MMGIGKNRRERAGQLSAIGIEKMDVNKANHQKT